MADELARLVARIRVDQIDTLSFRGRNPRHRKRRVFGGQVLAQALDAASRTVAAERAAHSMHANFLRPGDPATPIIYEIDPIFDGRSFSTRRVVARQNEEAVFDAAISFHAAQSGPQHQIDMPEVAPPEELDSDLEYLDRLRQQFPNVDLPKPNHAIESRTVDRPDYANPKRREPRLGVWMYANGEVDDVPALHQALLAYMSDMFLLASSLLPHAVTFLDQRYQFATLDHGLWFHREFRADNWLLFCLDSPTAGHARSFNRGSVYDRAGRLVASVVQEGLFRERRG